MLHPSQMLRCARCGEVCAKEGFVGEDSGPAQTCGCGVWVSWELWQKIHSQLIGKVHNSSICPTRKWLGSMHGVAALIRRVKSSSVHGRALFPALLTQIVAVQQAEVESRTEEQMQESSRFESVSALHNRSAYSHSPIPGRMGLGRKEPVGFRARKDNGSRPRQRQGEPPCRIAKPTLQQRRRLAASEEPSKSPGAIPR